MMIACGCASEDCAVNGCRRVRELMQRPAPTYEPFRVPMPPQPQQELAHDGCRPLKPLTEADVRRIVREELASAQPHPKEQSDEH